MSRSEIDIYAVFLKLVAETRQQLISSLDYSEQAVPGSFPIAVYDPLNTSQELRAHRIAMNLIRRTVHGLAHHYAESPLMITRCATARFGLGEAHEQVLDFTLRLLPHNVAGQLSYMAVQNDRGDNHVFMIYFPQSNIPTCTQNTSVISWLKSLPQNILNTAILVDPLRDLVMPLNNPGYLQALLHFLESTGLDCLIAQEFHLLQPSEDQIRQYEYIQANAKLLYESARLSLLLFCENKLQDGADASFIYLYFLCLNSSYRPKRNWISTALENKIQHTGALDKLNEYSGLNFFGAARPDHTVDAIATVDDEQFGIAQTVAAKLNGELFANTQGGFTLFVKGINVSKRNAQNHEMANLERIHAL